ncbi:kinase-like domain-containing protein [Suillus paluster]|uniref:kinase-like domain-containing protein n=1 Tax=Suillus paluster TaxID=48578 RepID=UPI001B8772D3|nr:kinase-like domain-containing protein [Suillus paluster]KAG1723354.1 kinase-like domain-containing protein [Suillus paluster]
MASRFPSSSDATSSKSILDTWEGTIFFYYAEFCSMASSWLSPSGGATSSKSIPDTWEGAVGPESAYSPRTEIPGASSAHYCWSSSAARRSIPATLSAVSQFHSNLGTNPGDSAASTADLRFVNLVSPDEQLEMPNALQGAFPNSVPTTSPSMFPAPQARLSVMPNGTQPPQMGGTKPAILPPTREQLAHAEDVIQNLKHAYSTKLPTMPHHKLSDDQRMEYYQLLQQLQKMTQDLDVKLPLYWIVLRSDNMIRNLVAIVSLVAHQRASYSRRSNLVIIDPSALKSMYSLLQYAAEHFRHQTMEAVVALQQMDDGLAGVVINRPSPPPTAPNIIPSTQSIPPISIPDFTGHLTRCSQDPVSGGTYGNIYKCVYRTPEGYVMVAVKAIRPQFLDTAIMLVFRRELGIWKRLEHPNILKFMGTTGDFGPYVALVAPWIVNNTLTSFLKNNDTLTPRDRLLLLRGVAAGLDYLHTFRFTVNGQTYFNTVVHGDLSGNNVLIGSDNTAYLADFGMSGALTKSPGMTYLMRMSDHPGAVRWAARELLTVDESASAVTTQSDIYSFGCIMLQVLTGDIPWRHLKNDFAIWSKVSIGEIHPRPHCVIDRYWNFMARCWSETPTDRPSAKEILQFIDSELAQYYRANII